MVALASIGIILNISKYQKNKALSDKEIHINMKIVFTGGGTDGGHFYPIIAIAEKVNRS